MALSFVSTIGRLPLTPVRFGRSTARCAARPRWFASSAAIVDKAIIDNNVMVFSASYCPYCRQVKSLFKELNVDHAVWELDERADGDDIRGILLEKTGQRTVPNVFISGKHVGGCDDDESPLSRNMFKLITMEDVILVPARLFGYPRLESLEYVINKRLSDKIIPGVGLVIAFWDWVSIGEDALQIHNGESNTKCAFRVVVFSPFEGEVVFGRVSGAYDGGVFMEMGFFDAITVRKENLPKPSSYDEDERVWIWKPTFEEGGEPQTYYMDVTNESVFRIMELVFEDSWRIPPTERNVEGRNPMSIFAALHDEAVQDNQGLGDPLWWYEEGDGEEGDGGDGAKQEAEIFEDGGGVEGEVYDHEKCDEQLGADASINGY